MRLSNLAVIAQLNALLALLNAGVAGATIRLYTGSQPATVETAASGSLLGTLVCALVAFGGAVDNVGSAIATANIIASGTAVASGTATWFRALDSNGVAIIDGTVGQGTGELNLDDNTLVINNSIGVSLWTVSQAE